MQSNLLNKYVYNWFFLRMNLFSIFVMIVSYTLCLVLKSSIDPVLIGMVLVNIGSMQEQMYWTFSSLAELEA